MRPEQSDIDKYLTNHPDYDVMTETEILYRTAAFEAGWIAAENHINQEKYTTTGDYQEIRNKITFAYAQGEDARKHGCTKSTNPYLYSPEGSLERVLHEEWKDGWNDTKKRETGSC